MQEFGAAPVGYQTQPLGLQGEQDLGERLRGDVRTDLDAHLAAKGQAAPTPADPTNHAPKATSADGCTEQKEP